MVLKSVNRYFQNEEQLFQYNFDDSLSVTRDYIWPTTRIGQDVFVLKIPVVGVSLLLNEVILMSFILIVLFLLLNKILCMYKDHSLRGNSLSMFGVFICMTVIVYYSNKSFIPELGTFWLGKKTSGIVIKNIDYHDGVDEKSDYNLKIETGDTILLSDLFRNSYYKGESVGVKIHPDFVSYTVLNYPRRYILVSVFYSLAFFVIIYFTIKRIVF